jgi:hypothetical protein
MNPNCNEIICKECMETYLQYSEMTLPKCMCEAKYHYEDIKNLVSTIMRKKYERCCVEYVKATLVNTINTEIVEKKVLNALRKDKREFINKMPKALAYVLNHSMKEKVRKIERDILSKQKKTTPTNCCDILCNGILKQSDLLKNGTCSECGVTFCLNCEKKQTPQHVCKQEDVDSIQFIKTLVQCPNCKLRVIRSYGCNFITCSHCQTNFDYITGMATHSGNHDTATLTLKTTLAERLVDLDDENALDLRAAIMSLEAKRPKICVVTSKFVEKSTPTQVAKKLSKELFFRYKRQRYEKVIQQLETAKTQNTLTLDLIDKLRKVLV